MTNKLVLITGTSGHVGFRVLRYALEFGYKVRAAVRNEAKADAVRSNPVLKAMGKDNDLSFAIVPDITAPNAYDEAVKGVDYVIHVASPLGSNAKEGDDLQEALVRPAVEGTLNILRSAKGVQTVKRIVITSSTAAVTPFEYIVGGQVGGRFNAESRLPTPTAPYQGIGAAYYASKAAALNAAEAWVKKESPGFDLVHVHPSFVEGRNDMTTSLKDFMAGGTNRMVMNPVLGQKMDPMAFSTNHVDDTAWVHVKALDASIPGNQSYLTASSSEDGVGWNDAKDIVAKHFPEAVKSGILPNNGDLPSLSVPYDSSKTEKTFGFKLASFESQVVSVVSHYLELYQKDKNSA